MKYTIYDNKDLELAVQDGNYPASEFSNFVSQLIEQERWENDIEKGIIAIVNSKGTRTLSDKQSKVLEIIVSRFDSEECRICGVKIPLSEVFDLDDNDGLCSYHKHQFDKDKE